VEGCVAVYFAEVLQCDGFARYVLQWVCGRACYCVCCGEVAVRFVVPVCVAVRFVGAVRVAVSVLTQWVRCSVCFSAIFLCECGLDLCVVVCDSL